MALSKDAKKEAVEKVKTLLAESRMTVAAKYSGTTVKELQALRRDARENGTTILVVKNRLFKKAMEEQGFGEAVKDMPLTGQLMYAFNPSDEAAAAQILANFAKANPQVELITGIDSEGQAMVGEDLNMLATLPSKDQLRAMLVGTIGAPVSGFASVMAANVRGVMNVLTARADNLS